MTDGSRGSLSKLRIFRAGLVGLLVGTLAAPASVTAAPARCGKAPNAKGTLTIEWSSTARAALVKRAENGLVVLRHTGCEVEVLAGCSAEGAYSYTSKKNEKVAVSLSDADALYEAIPVGASTLESRIAGGKLTVDMVVAGRYDASSKDLPSGELQGSCDGATHVVTGWTTGTFGTSAKGGVFHSVGDAAACVEQKEPAGPPLGCGAPLSIELLALPGAEEEAVKAAKAAEAAAKAAAEPAEPSPVVEDEPKRKHLFRERPKQEPVERGEWKAGDVHIGAWAGAGGGLALAIGAFVTGGVLVGSVQDPDGKKFLEIIAAANDSLSDGTSANDVDPDMSGDLCATAREPGDEKGGVTNFGVADACDTVDSRLKASTAMWITGSILVVGTGVAVLFVYLTGKKKKATATRSTRFLAGPAPGGATVGFGGRF